MKLFKQHRALIIGTSLIVLTNAIALGGVAYNRSGTPDSRLTLGERELIYNNYQHDDNSGVAVQFTWKVLSRDIVGEPLKNQSYDWYNYSREAYWLTEKKLQELGFDTTQPNFPAEGAYRFKQLKDREVYLVLEQNGPSYQRYVVQAKEHAKATVDKAEAARQIIEAEQESTRLFVIDADTNAENLRGRYPNRNMHAIVKGIISANWQSTTTKPVLNAYISSLSVSSLHVSKPHDTVFTKSAKKYQVNVAYGQRHEPWIVGAKRE